MKKTILVLSGTLILVMAAPASGDQPAAGCAAKQAELASLEAAARASKEYVGWVSGYRKAKRELDDSVSACMDATKPFAQGPVGNSKNPTCPGNFMNPCAYDCFPAHKKPPIDEYACRELFCKKGQRITRGYSTRFGAAQGTAYSAQAESGTRFELLQSMNQDRNRLRSALKLTKNLGDEPDPDVIEREADEVRGEAFRKVEGARALYTMLCSR